MSQEAVLENLRTTLANLYLAGMHLPRHTPNCGSAGTEHTYKLSAAQVWTFDKAMGKAADALGISDLPHSCCVGSRSFDERMADLVTENARQILSREP